MRHRSLNNFSMLCLLIPRHLVTLQQNASRKLKPTKSSSTLTAILPSIYFRSKKNVVMQLAFIAWSILYVFHLKFSLSFLPLPLCIGSKEHYRKLVSFMGKHHQTRPTVTGSCSKWGVKSSRWRKSLLVCGKVRNVIICGECHKPRCVYSVLKLSKEQIVLVESIKESNLYTSGAPLFPPGLPLENSIVVMEALVCSLYIETQYYSAVLIHFEPVCYFCGLWGEESLIDNDEIWELKSSYAVVYPICFLCKVMASHLIANRHRTWKNKGKRNTY